MVTNKLKKVEYFNIDGKMKAIELYEDDKIVLVELKDGISSYVLNGDTSKKKKAATRFAKGGLDE